MKGIVFGKKQEKAITKLNKIISDYEMYWNVKPINIRESRNEYSVTFSNGDTWQAVKFSENQRGRKGNIILLDEEIDSENKITIAHCCCHNRPYGAVMYY